MDNQQKELSDDSGERGRPDDEHGGDREKKFNVTIIYNGLERSLEVNSKQSVQALLAHALALFGVQGTSGLVLLLEGGTPLNPNGSVEDAGVVPGSRLLLRPAQMQSGVTCG